MPIYNYYTRLEWSFRPFSALNVENISFPLKFMTFHHSPATARGIFGRLTRGNGWWNWKNIESIEWNDNLAWRDWKDRRENCFYLFWFYQFFPDKRITKLDFHFPFVFILSIFIIIAPATTTYLQPSGTINEELNLVRRQNRMGRGKAAPIRDVVAELLFPVRLIVIFLG